MGNFPIELLVKAWPGAFGSALSAFFLKDVSFVRRFIFFASGSIFSAAGAPSLSPFIHLDDGFLLRFIIGFAAMTFLAKCLDTWQTFNAATIARDIVRRWAGLPPAITKPGALAAPKE